MNTEKKKYIILFAALCTIGVALILLSGREQSPKPQPVSEPETVSTLETTKARLASFTRRVDDYQLSDDTVSGLPGRFRDKAAGEQASSVPDNNGAMPTPTVRSVVKTANAIPAGENNAAPPPPRRAGFNDGTAGHETGSFNLNAVVQQTSDVSHGSAVQLRVTQDYAYPGGVVRANTFLTGTVSIETNRVTIRVPASGNLPELTAYDTDGMRGLKLSDSVKDELRNDAGNTAVDVAGDAASSAIRAPLLGRVVSSVVSGLKKKTNNYRITLEKGQKVILKG